MLGNKPVSELGMQGMLKNQSELYVVKILLQ